MNVIKTIRPGRDGSKRFVERFGDSLVCVRYRRDPASGRNVITVELVAERIPRPKAEPEPEPPKATPAAKPSPSQQPGEPRVYLNVAPYEHALQQRLRVVGGRWDRTSGRWCVAYQAARRLNLVGRIDPVLSARAGAYAS